MTFLVEVVIEVGKDKTELQSNVAGHIFMEHSVQYINVIIV